MQEEEEELEQEEDEEAEEAEDAVDQEEDDEGLKTLIFDWQTLACMTQVRAVRWSLRNLKLLCHVPLDKEAVLLAPLRDSSRPQQLCVYVCVCVSYLIMYPGLVYNISVMHTQAESRDRALGVRLPQSQEQAPTPRAICCWERRPFVECLAV